MKPWELEALQPHEIEKMFQGHTMAEQKRNWTRSYFTMLLLAPYTTKKSKITVAAIMKPLLPKKETDPEELLAEKEHYSRMAQKMEKKKGG